MISTRLAFFLLFAIVISSNAQNDIRGTINSVRGEPLAGATVLLKDTDIGTASDENGAYSLNKVPPQSNILVFSYLGYESKEVEIGGRKVIDVQLIEASSELDQVVVVGFGTQNKRKITGSISSVGEEVFENVSVSNFQSALSGQIPGLSITQNSGALGSDVTIRVRGISSINAGNQPLFVLDGMVLSESYNVYDPSGSAGINPLININPNDIESIDVLKDASAASVYGARGGNGVILITTKRGKFNTKPKVNLNFYAGFTDATNRYDVLSGKEYASVWNRAAEAVGHDENSGLFYDVESQPNTDWYSLINRKGFVHETSASVSGGTEKTKYYIGGTYRDEEAYFKGKGLKRYSFRANIDQAIGEKFVVGLSINPSRTENNYGWENWILDNPISIAASFFPNVAAKDENGKTVDGFVTTDIGQSLIPGTPLANQENGLALFTTTQVLLNTYLSYYITPSLYLKTSLAVEHRQIENLIRDGSETTSGIFFNNGFGAAENNQTLNYNLTNLLTFENTFAKSHDLDLTLGFHLTKEVFTSSSVDGSNFPNDRLLFLNSAAQVGFWSSAGTEFAFLGYLARANYAFNNRYLISLSARYDGSSRFGKGNQYGFFPAVSAGWILSDESFMKNVPAVHFLKLRSSLGLAGNAEIGNFAARGLVGFGNNYNGQPGFTFQSLENEKLQWEKTRQWDIGLDFGLLGNRITGSLGYYIKNTTDLLLEVPLPTTNGFRSVLKNAGEVSNQGFEFELIADIFKGPFKWNLSINGATLKNKILSLVDKDNDGEDDDINRQVKLYRTGEPIASFFLVEYAGVDPETGDALFFDLDGNTLVNNASDANRKVLGKNYPDFLGGISNSFFYKKIDLSFFLQFAQGFKLYRFEARQYLETGFSFSPSNLAKSQLDAWTPENTGSTIPEIRLNTGNGNQNSSRFLDNADYIRVKNIQLGYTLSNIGTNNIKLRIFASAQNWFTFTKFPGLDPEASVSSSEGTALGGVTVSTWPQTKTFTFGFNIDL